MASKTSIQLHEEQTARDIKHHQERIAWLTRENPVWACGEPVSRKDRSEMLRASRAILENPILGSNTGPQAQ